MKVIQGATVYTMNQQNDVIEDCDILIHNGKIVKMGHSLPVEDSVERISGKGYIVTPGLIDAHTHVGIQGEVTDGMNDHNEISSPYQPLMSAIDAINPFHHSFRDARAGGVTTVQTGAGSHNVIGGVWCVIKTTGTSVEEMVIREKSGLKGALGENIKYRHGQVARTKPFTRMAIANILRSAFTQAKQAVDNGWTDTMSLYKHGKEDLEPFVDVLLGKMPLRLHAHRADDITTAIRIAKEFDIQLSIEHCTEGYQILPYIKESGYPVVLGPLMGEPTKYETRNLNQASPKLLNEAGILVAINTDHPVNPIQYLSIAAAISVKHGMDEMQALRAITINPATICGVEDRIGSIEEGKDADLVIWTEHPLRARANVLKTMIDGYIVYENQHLTK